MKHSLDRITRLAGLAGLALLSLSIAASGESSATPSAPDEAVQLSDVAAPPAPGTLGGDEIKRFCSNIADAAKDRRFALQAKELQDLQAEIDRRIKALDDKRAEYETWMKKREAFLAQAQDGLVKIYSGMRPDAAAERLAELKPDLAAGILIKLDARKAGTILNEMKSKEAAVLTTIMASAVRREDPS